jgi:hypothetical protein
MAVDSHTSGEVSRALNEPLYGTIKPASAWFLLEYNGIYTSEAWRDSRIPAAVKDKLDNYPNSHPLLVRQPGHLHAHDRQVTLFAINAAAQKPSIYKIELDSYDDILRLDLDALLDAKIIVPEKDALYIVCTNGKRDQCCAQFGTALYDKLATLTQGQVWQSSHIGGHRLAATMYCFPHAICYGFLSEKDAPEILESYSKGRLLLKKFRGHAIWDKPIQAAEYFLRRELKNDKIDDLALLNVEADGESWRIQFALSDIKYEVEISSAEPLMVLATTGDTEYKAIPQFQYIGHKVIN